MPTDVCNVMNWIYSLPWGPIPTWVTACVALWATFTWRRQLKYQRGDELILAAIHLQGAIYKALAFVDYGNPNEIFGKNISDAYLAGREFRARMIVAKRYYKCLRVIDVNAVIKQIDAARDSGKKFYKLSKSEQVEGSYAESNKHIKVYFAGLVERLTIIVH